ncbi:MAG: hypothetical protein IJ134_02980 [Bacilli bacterium]|nr:hypothetical protein [Bacilli bacterium]
MEKSKSELAMVVLTVILGILSFYFFMQSKQQISTVVDFKENGGVKYKVYLNDKTYYNRDYLDEGMQYISSIVDYIDLNFNYKATYDIKDTFDINKKIVADIKIVDTENNDKVIYSENDILKQDANTSENIDVSDQIKIDYTKYNNLANKFKSDYGISANCNLVIDYDLMYESKENDIVGSKKMTVEIPLSRQMINISKSSDISSNEPYSLRTSESPLNKVMFGISIMLAALGFVSLVILALKIKSRLSKESKYERYIKKLLRENDSYITESNNSFIDSNAPVVSINSFKELLDVRNNLEKPIIYVKVNENESKFVIMDTQNYEYKVTRKEMD